MTHSAPGSPAVVAITGGSRGIGREVAESLADAGHAVHTCSRSAISPRDSVHHSIVDITSENDVATWAAEIASQTASVDVVINNAGLLGKRERIEHLTSDDWDAVLRTNICGPALVSRYLVPLLRAGNYPLVINIGSSVGRIPRFGLSMYAVSKAALASLTECLAQELLFDGIKVVHLLPSRVNSELRRQGYGDEPPHPDANMSNVVSSIAYLIERRASITSGVTLACDDVGLWYGC